MKKAVVFIKGGFGNQLFQFSFANYLQENNYKVFLDTSLLFMDIENTKRKLVLPISQFNFKKRHYLSSKMFNVFLKLNYSKFLNISIFKKFLSKYFYTKEKDLEKENNSKIIFFNGYWKDIKYADYSKNFILEALSKSQVIEKSLNFKKSDNKIAIHVRRKDFIPLGWELSLNYYVNSIEHFKNNLENPEFEVFTDDLLWVKSNEIFNSVNNIFPQISNDDDIDETIETFSKMLNYKHFLCSNSTFSFWAAFINSQEDSIITVPSPWIKNHSHPILKLENWIEINST